MCGGVHVWLHASYDEAWLWFCKVEIAVQKQNAWLVAATYMDIAIVWTGSM